MFTVLSILTAEPMLEIAKTVADYPSSASDTWRLTAVFVLGVIAMGWLTRYFIAELQKRSAEAKETSDSFRKFLETFVVEQARIIEANTATTKGYAEALNNTTKGHVEALNRNTDIISVLMKQLRDNKLL